MKSVSDINNQYLFIMGCYQFLFYREVPWLVLAYGEVDVYLASDGKTREQRNFNLNKR